VGRIATCKLVLVSMMNSSAFQGILSTTRQQWEDVGASNLSRGTYRLNFSDNILTLLGVCNHTNHIVPSVGPRFAYSLHMMPISRPKTPWIRIVEQEERPSVGVEELLGLLQAKKAEGTFIPERVRPFLNGFPLATTMLGTMIVALGIMLIILKFDIALLKSDIDDLKTLKGQVTSLDPQIQITDIERRLEDMKKEKELIKGELAQLLSDVETIKTERRQEMNKPPGKIKGRPPTTNNKIQEIKKVESLLRKKSHNDTFFSDLSRAITLDSPLQLKTP
jgi:hypothetical protein